MIPVNVWADQLTKIISLKVKQKQGKSERLKNLKQNVDILVNILKQINIKANQEKNRKGGDPTRVEIYSHPIFAAIGEVFKILDRINFKEAKDLIGKSLRDDYSVLEQQS